MCFSHMSYVVQRHVKDNPVVDCAVWGRAQFLVSYDNDFLKDSILRQALFEFGVEIVDPRYLSVDNPGDVSQRTLSHHTHF